MTDERAALPSVTVNPDAPAVKRLKGENVDVTKILAGETRTRKNKKVTAGKPFIFVTKNIKTEHSSQYF